MADVRAHKYYCVRCDRFMYGETLAYLASAVNYHATSQHPSDFANWTAGSIESSTQYSGTKGPLPQYLAPHGTTSHKVPTITDEDRAMLAAGLVRW
jgi:hypothetical protein